MLLQTSLCRNLNHFWQMFKLSINQNTILCFEFQYLLLLDLQVEISEFNYFRISHSKNFVLDSK